jgi:putative redox protein
MRARARWTAGMAFEGTNADGARVVMDARPEHGGAGGGPAPMETLLLALAGCTGMDVISILRKMRAPLGGLTIEASGERAAEHPRVFTAIHLRYLATGDGLQAEQVHKAVTLSQEQYCSVSAMLRKAVPVTYDIVVTPAHPARAG